MAGLLSLIGQAIGAPAAEVNSDLIVNGKKDTPRQAPPLASLLPPYDAGRAEELQQRSEQYPERKGRLFGTKGTLRDVLGTLGDAFLVQSGNKAVYAPRREQERLADAMGGFYTGNESEQLAALEQASYENPEMASKLYGDYMQNKARQAQVQSVADNRENMAATRKASIIDKFTTKFGQALNGATTDEQRQAILRVAGKQAASMGISLEDIGVEDGTLTPEEQQAFVSGATTVNQQNTLPIRKYQAETSRINATKPKEFAPRTRSISQVDADVADAVLAGRATPAQKKYYEDRLKKASKKGKFDPSSLPLPPGFDKNKIKKVN